jgi:hypothetical protein
MAKKKTKTTSKQHSFLPCFSKNYWIGFTEKKIIPVYFFRSP